MTLLPHPLTLWHSHKDSRYVLSQTFFLAVGASIENEIPECSLYM